MRAEPGGEAQLWLVVRQWELSVGKQWEPWLPLGGWQDWPPAGLPGSQAGMAVTRPFVPCNDKELKAETAFSPRGIPSASHSWAINS